MHGDYRLRLVGTEGTAEIFWARERVEVTTHIARYPRARAAARAPAGAGCARCICARRDAAGRYGAVPGRDAPRAFSAGLRRRGRPAYRWSTQQLQHFRNRPRGNIHERATSYRYRWRRRDRHRTRPPDCRPGRPGETRRRHRHRSQPRRNAGQPLWRAGLWVGGGGLCGAAPGSCLGLRAERLSFAGCGRGA